MPERVSNGHADAVLFDMDGTLTRPYFDFDLIRAELGLTNEPRTPILEALEQMRPEDRARAEAILHRHEEMGALESELCDDAHDVLAAIREAGIPIGLITRNSRRSVATVCEKHALVFSRIHTREDGPVKPAPDAVLGMCAHFGVEPKHTWMVGDYLFDMQAGNAAGANTVLIINDKPEPEFALLADHVIRRLTELLALLGL